MNSWICMNLRMQKLYKEKSSKKRYLNELNELQVVWFVQKLMSIQLEKIVEVYERSAAVIQAKTEILSNNPLTDVATDKINRKQRYEFEPCPVIIRGSIHKVISMWMRKLNVLQEFKQIHGRCSNHLSEKANSLKNNTELLSKEDQLLSVLEETINRWETRDDAVTYYNIKNRMDLQRQITGRLQQIKQNEVKTRESAEPMFDHKIEKEVKENVYMIYNEETKIDSQVIEITVNLHNYLADKVMKYSDEVESMESPNYLISQKNQFYEQHYDLLGSRSKINEKNFNKYLQSINQITKKNYAYWSCYRKSLNDLVLDIDEYTSNISKSQEKFFEVEKNIYKLLEDVPNSIGNIFRVEIVYSMMKMFNRTYELSSILLSLKEKIQKFKDYVIKAESTSREYMSHLSKEVSDRMKRFQSYILQDKKFIEDAIASERVINSTLIHFFKQFSAECYNLLKKNRRKFSEQNKIQIYEEHHINRILSKLIISESSRLETENTANETIKKSGRLSRANSICSHRQTKHQTNEKIRKFELFVNNMEIFDFDSVKWETDVYVCALGPKLLLHGKLKILPEGICFQSFFNKKNLFFGKTKMFIPRSDILELDEKNTLIVFPDIVEIKTSHGLINYHALGARREIFNALTAAYFPENNREDSDCPSQADFKEYINTNSPPMDTTKLEQHYQIMCCDVLYKNCKLNKFYRRYFSDDEFQIRGKTYANFRNYFLEQIEGIDPKGTPITPEAPSYFSYRAEDSSDNYPEYSERYHTYGKKVPKIPFISNGGEGLCEDKQTYRWCSPRLIIIESVNVLKGFSLTEGMQILTKTILKEESEANTRLSISASVRFSTNSSTNSLLKSPIISTLKQGIVKMADIIQKYEKGKKHRATKKIDKNDEVTEQLRTQIDEITSENKKLKKQIKWIVIGFAAFQVVSNLILYII